MSEVPEDLDLTQLGVTGGVGPAVPSGQVAVAAPVVRQNLVATMTPPPLVSPAVQPTAPAPVQATTAAVAQAIAPAVAQTAAVATTPVMQSPEVPYPVAAPLKPGDPVPTLNHYPWTPLPLAPVELAPVPKIEPVAPVIAAQPIVTPPPAPVVQATLPAPAPVQQMPPPPAPAQPAAPQTLPPQPVTPPPVAPEPIPAAILQPEPDATPIAEPKPAPPPAAVQTPAAAPPREEPVQPVQPVRQPEPAPSPKPVEAPPVAVAAAPVGGIAGATAPPEVPHVNIDHIYSVSTQEVWRALRPSRALALLLIVSFGFIGVISFMLLQNAGLSIYEMPFIKDTLGLE